MKNFAIRACWVSPGALQSSCLRIVTPGLDVVKARTDVRKAFEWIMSTSCGSADFMHGPPVRSHNRSGQSHPVAIIDDHSRMVGRPRFCRRDHQFPDRRAQEAFLAYGIPKRLYVDNGPSFSSELLAKAAPWPVSP